MQIHYECRNLQHSVSISVYNLPCVQDHMSCPHQNWYVKHDHSRAWGAQDITRCFQKVSQHNHKRSYKKRSVHSRYKSYKINPLLHTDLADGSKDGFEFQKHVAGIVVVVLVEVGKVRDVNKSHNPIQHQTKNLAKLNESILVRHLTSHEENGILSREAQQVSHRLLKESQWETETLREERATRWMMEVRWLFLIGTRQLFWAFPCRFCKQIMISAWRLDARPKLHTSKNQKRKKMKA